MGNAIRRRSAYVALAVMVPALTVAAVAGAGQASATGTASIKITEVAYGGKIAGADGDGEYVELTNVGTAPQSFAGWTYSGKPGAGTLPLDDFGTVDPGESVLITDVTAPEFRTEWGLSGSVKIIDDKSNGLSVTLDKGPDTPTVFDNTGAIVDDVSYAAGFFPGKGVSAYPDAAHLGAEADTTGWTLSTAGDGEGSWTSASGSVGSPGTTPLATKAPDIRISEVAYGGKMGTTDGDGEYVELTNVGTAPQDFTGWTYTSKDGSSTLPLDDFGTVDPGASVLITDVTADEFRTEWNLPASVAIIDDKANGLSATLDKGPDTPTVYDNTGTIVDDVSYAAGFFPGKGVSAYPDSAHLGAAADTTGWTLSTAGDGEGSTTSASGATGSPGSYVAVGQSSGDDTGGGSTTPPPGTSSLPSVAWPGPQAVTTVDNTDFGQNLSGLFYVAGATRADDYMWGVENGDSGAPLNTGESSLFKIVQDANGNWGPAAGWEQGVKLHYPDGTGQPDSEGVTAVGGKVFVSTERDNLNGGVSKVSILEYDPSQVSGGAINATREWNLEPDFNLPPADANLGMEALAFVPDGYLVANGFKTDAGATYDPSQYGDHFGGVFFGGLEADGNIYAYVLQSDGSFHRIASFNSGFNTIMDAAWDPSQDALWLDCDNTCGGQTSIAKLDTTAGDANQGHFSVSTVYDRPTGGPNVNNEGFTFQPPTECDATTGLRSVWWSDDGDDSGHAIRTAQATCATPIAGQVGAKVTTAVTAEGTTTPAKKNAAGAYTTPVTVTFTCSNQDAVLNQACPAPVNVTSSQAAKTVATLTDTLGKTYPVTVPAIQIAKPLGTLHGKRPTISGTAKVGKRLTAHAGAWTPKGVHLAYRWFANGKAIKGGTKASLKLTRSLKGKKVTVKVTGTLTGYKPLTEASAAKRVR